jgi:amino acid transporter
LHPRTFDFITLFAVSNTMLINYIMGSRLLYGMAHQGLLPPVLSRVHPKRHTPHVAILMLLVVVLALAVLGNISIQWERNDAGQWALNLSTGSEGVKTLASATALLLLFAFLAVDASLVVLKLRPGEPKGAFEVPIFVPVAGVVINATLIVARLTERDAGLRAPLIAGIIVLCVSALYFLIPPKNVTEDMLAAIEQET